MNYEQNLNLLLENVKTEVVVSTSKYGEFNSFHEGLAVLWEEFEEIKAEVFKHTHDPELIIAESKQVAAMAIKMMQLAQRNT